MGVSTDTPNQLRHNRQHFTFGDEDMSVAQREALVSPRAGAKSHENIFTEEKTFGSSLVS